MVRASTYPSVLVWSGFPSATPCRSALYIHVCIIIKKTFLDKMKCDVGKMIDRDVAEKR